MSGFGEKLRRERETHGATLEDVARATEVDVRYLRALENDEIDALPGPAFGKFYIRAYAETLGFDPRALIAEYDRVQHEIHRAPPAPQPPKKRRERWDESRSDPPNPRSEPAGSPATGAADAGDAIGTAPGETRGSTSVEELREAPAGESASDASPSAAEAVDGSAGEHDDPMSIARAVEGVPVLSRRATTTALAVVAGLVLVASAYFAFRGPVGTGSRTGLAESSVARAAANSEEAAPDKPLAASSVPHVEANDASGAETFPPTEAPSEVRSADRSSGLHVTEFGVGRRMVGRRLEERGSRFEEGTVVWFSTRVRGGASGERIRHVWIHGNGVVQTIELELGGSHWRTHSSKTLWGRGAWAVEARDSEGRVLARSEFTCASAG